MTKILTSYFIVKSSIGITPYEVTEIRYPQGM